MGSREFPFDERETCDNCGAKGAFDLYGDFLCNSCLSGPDKGTFVEDNSHEGFKMNEPGVMDA